MEYKFSCPSCGQHIAAEPALSGVIVSCPSCEASFVAPTAPTTLPASHRRWLVPAAVVGGLLLLIGTIAVRFWPGGHSRNLLYWQSLQPIWEETRTRPRPDMALQQTHQFDEYAAQWSKKAAADQVLAQKLRALPAKGVDAELIENILRTAEFYDSASLLDMDAATIAMEMKAYFAKHESEGALLESMLRGLAGDSPMNKFYESQADARRIQNMQASWLERGRALDESQRALAANLARIRIRLAQQDGADY